MEVLRLRPAAARPLVALIALSLLFLAAPSDAVPVCTDQATGVNDRCPSWSAAYNHAGGRGGDGEDIGRAVAVSPDGATVFLTGQSLDDGTAQDQATVAFSAATGEMVWSARTDAAAQFDTGSAIAVDPQGSRVFVTGRSIESEAFDWLTTAHDAANGEVLWRQRLAGTKGVDDTSFDVATSPDGATVYVAGTVDDGAGIPGDGLVEAYDAETGLRRWAGRYDGGGYDGGLRVAAAPDGSAVYLLGTTRRTTGNDYLVAAFEAEDEERLGERLWAVAHDGAGGWDNVVSFALSADGETIVVTGTSPGLGGNNDVLTVALDAGTGELRWSEWYDSTRNGNDTAAGVAIAGDVAVVGATGHEGTHGTDYVTMAYDLVTGEQRWTQIANSGGILFDTARVVAASETQVFVSGYHVIPRMETQPIFKIEPGMLMTVSYDAVTGEQLWVARHNESGVGADVTVAGATSPDGGTFYAAGTFITTGVFVYPVAAAKAYAYDMGVIAYDA